MPRHILPVKPPPDPAREQAVHYYRFAPGFFRRHFGAQPSRTTLANYLAKGYPVIRGGPYVRLPLYYALKRPKTTVQAMSRFLTVVRAQERKFLPQAAAV